MKNYEKYADEIMRLLGDTQSWQKVRKSDGN